MSRLKSAFEQMRREPVRGTLRLLRGNLMTRSHFLRLRLDLNDQSRIASVHHHPAPGLRVERGSLDRLRALRSDPAGGQLPPDFFEDKTHGLNRFYLGFLDQRMAHVTWLAGSTDPTTVSGWAPENGAVELRNVCTLPFARRRGLFARVAQHLIDDLAKDGCPTAYAHVDLDNAPSLGAFEAMGFVRESRISTLRVLGRDFHTTRTLSVPTLTP